MKHNLNSFGKHLFGNNFLSVYVSEKSEKPKFCFSPDATPFVPKSFQATKVAARDTKASTLSVEAREFYPRNFVPEVSTVQCLFFVSERFFAYLPTDISANVDEVIL